MKDKSKRPKLTGRQLREELNRISMDYWRKLILWIKNIILRNGKVLGIEHIIDADDAITEAILRRV